MAKQPNRNSSEPKTDDGRTPQGRFAPGNPGNPNAPGRPPRSVEERYLEDLRTAVTPERWLKIVKRAIDDAAAGDTAARTWLGKYLLPDLQKLQIQTAGTLADWLAQLSQKA